MRRSYGIPCRGGGGGPHMLSHPSALAHAMISKENVWNQGERLYTRTSPSQELKGSVAGRKEHWLGV